MKKYISYTASFKMQYVFSFLLILCGFSLLAQDNNQLRETIAFDSPFSYSLEEKVSWEIKDGNGAIAYSGTGDVSVGEFATPGSYTLYITDNRSHGTKTDLCEHTHFPSQIAIDVKPVKLGFDFDTIRFSNAITGGQSSKGIIVSVNVNLLSFDNGDAIYNTGLTSFGVGSTISGKVKNGEAILTPGKNTLEFVLEGQAEAGNNIQLNFVDFNGEVQPYTLTPKVQ